MRKELIRWSQPLKGGGCLGSLIRTRRLAIFDWHLHCSGLGWYLLPGLLSKDWLSWLCYRAKSAWVLNMCSFHTTDCVRLTVSCGMHINVDLTQFVLPKLLQKPKSPSKSIYIYIWISEWCSAACQEKNNSGIFQKSLEKESSHMEYFFWKYFLKSIFISLEVYLEPMLLCLCNAMVLVLN